MILPFVRLFFCVSVSTVNCVWKFDLKVMVPSFVGHPYRLFQANNVLDAPNKLLRFNSVFARSAFRRS
jgi:hypothetical protein